MVFTEFKNTIETITITIVKKSQGQQYHTAYIKGENLVSSLHYDMHLKAVKEKEQSDKQSSIINTLNCFHSSQLLKTASPNYDTPTPPTFPQVTDEVLYRLKCAKDFTVFSEICYLSLKILFLLFQTRR